MKTLITPVLVLLSVLVLIQCMLYNPDRNDIAAQMEQGTAISLGSKFVCPLEPCNLSIVFMGDSLTRFMYYSLVYYLKNNQWIAPESYPHLVKPADFFGGNEANFDWAPWYNASTKELYPYENCDCHREPGSLAVYPGNYWTIENRYFHDPIRNNTVVYFQSFGTAFPIRGHWEDPMQAMKAHHQDINENEDINNSNTNSIPPVGPFLSRIDYAWNYTWPDAIRHQVSKIQPEVLVLNAGKWYHQDFHQQEYFNNFADAINNSNIPRVIWKTSTSDKGGTINPNLPFLDAKMCEQDWLECFDITGWTSKLSEGFYVDNYHFIEPVYRKMNEQLFDYLGIKYQGDESLRPAPLEWETLGIDNKILDDV